MIALKSSINSGGIHVKRIEATQLHIQSPKGFANDSLRVTISSMFENCSYNILQPDLFSECLSYLLPDELSQASELLPLTTRKAVGDTTKLEIQYAGELAAWLAVRSLADRAEKFWEEEAATGVNGESCEDAQLVELQKLISEDTTIVGKLFRCSSTRTNTASRGPLSAHRKAPFSRFEDETWESLYGLVYGVATQVDDDMIAHETFENLRQMVGDPLLETLAVEVESCGRGVYKTEAIALILGLVFGAPAFPVILITQKRRLKIYYIAEALGDHHTFSALRSCVVSLRLADEGHWWEAFIILKAHWCKESFDSYSDDGISLFGGQSEGGKSENSSIREPKKKRFLKRMVDRGKCKGKKRCIGELNDNLLPIDCMIYTSTFLVDYTERTLGTIGPNDLEMLAAAVRLGRKALDSILDRLELESESQSKSKFDSTDKDKLWFFSESASDTKPPSSNMPLLPKPMESLFANDNLRLMHAKLALGKALALLANLVAQKPSETKKLRNLGVLPLLDKYKRETDVTDTIDEKVKRLEKKFKRGYPVYYDGMKWLHSFLEESRQHLVDTDSFMPDEQSINIITSKDAAFLPLVYELRFANAGRVHFSSCTADSVQLDEKFSLQGHRSILVFGFTLKWIMQRILSSVSKSEDDEGNHWLCVLVESVLDIFLKSGRYFVEAIHSANHLVPRMRSTLPFQHTFSCMKVQEELPKNMNPLMLLDFARLVAIHRYGSSHPRTEHIEDRYNKFSQDRKSILQKYHDVATWLKAEFGEPTLDMTDQGNYRAVLESLEEKLKSTLQEKWENGHLW